MGEMREKIMLVSGILATGVRVSEYEWGMKGSRLGGGVAGIRMKQEKHGTELM